MKAWLFAVFGLAASLAFCAPAHAQDPLAPWCGNSNPLCVWAFSGSSTAAIPNSPLRVPAWVTNLYVQVNDVSIGSTYTFQIQTSKNGSSWSNCGSSFTVASGGNNQGACAASSSQPWGYMQLVPSEGTGTFVGTVAAQSTLAGISALFLGGYPALFSQPASAQCLGFAENGSGLAIVNLDCGSSSVSGQASGVIPLATGPGTIGGQSHCDDGNTNPGDVTCVEPMIVSVAVQGTYTPIGQGNAPAMTTGQNVFYSFGKANAPNDQAGLLFHYIGDDSTANYACLNFNSEGCALTWYPTGLLVASAGLGLAVTTVAGLPSASGLPAGVQYVVQDSATITPGPCTGGGSNYMIAVNSGTAWGCH